MNKSVAVTLWCVLTMAVLALAGCSAVNDDGPAGGADIDEGIADAVPALIPTDFSQTYTDTDGTALVEYTCTMPQIENLDEREAWAKLNDAFQAAVEEDILELTDPETGYVKGAQEEREAFALQPAMGGFSPYAFERSYEETLNDGETLSIKTIYYMNTHGAHPNTLVDGLSFDVTGGQELSLADVLGEDWQQRIVDEVLAQTAGRLAQGDFFFEDYEDTIRTYDYEQASWYMSADGIHLVYNNYEIAPYAAGPQEFIIPTV
ncbi:MAG: DUF3298 and DUF4163 domain-containing protein [Syntrophomonadaceae bacterium]|nr:DUF3298 and DUF4163 domain-containing protein [Syntrophomonadaceae bacterium]